MRQDAHSKGLNAHSLFASMYLRQQLSRAARKKVSPERGFFDILETSA
jgi:hypothetical protein